MKFKVCYVLSVLLLTVAISGCVVPSIVGGIVDGVQEGKCLDKFNKDKA